MQKYGFWIIPENTSYQELEKIIEEYGLKYNSPLFTPHMTIHGVISSTDEEVIKIVEEVSKKIKPFELEIGEVEFSSTYHQCILARVKTSANLFNVYMFLRKAFGVEVKHVFMPHMSLVYGDFNMEEREKIAKEIKIKNRSFEAKKITIVRADSPDPENWKFVKQVTLG